MFSERQQLKIKVMFQKKQTKNKIALSLNNSTQLIKHTNNQE